MTGLDQTRLDQNAQVVMLIRQILNAARNANRMLILFDEVIDDPQQDAIHGALKGLRPPHESTIPGIGPSNPYNSSFLNGSSVLLNRSALRAAVQDLNRPNGKRILVVKDKDQPTTPGIYRTKTGKSHTVHYVSYLRVAKQEFQSIDIDLEELAERVPEESKGQIQPSDLAKVLLTKMKLPLTLLPERPNNSQWSNWVGDFVDNLEAELRSRGQAWWIVIDGFNAVILPNQTVLLVQGIAKMVSISLDNIRLVLLGYASTLPPDKVLPYVTEETLVRALLREEVFKELGKLYMQACLQRQIPATPESISDLVAQSMGSGDQQEYLFADLVTQVMACLTTL
jgi:hypothetical protein